MYMDPYMPAIYLPPQEAEIFRQLRSPSSDYVLDLAGRTIKIRQTRDPFVPNVRYIAYTDATLDSRGRLNMTKLGLGPPWFRYMVATSPGQSSATCTTLSCADGVFMTPWALRDALAFSGDENIVTVVECGDRFCAAYSERQRLEGEKQKLDKEARERRRKYWEGILERVCPPAAWLLGMHSSPTDDNAGIRVEDDGKGLDEEDSSSVASGGGRK